jgi:chorismate mutase
MTSVLDGRGRRWARRSSRAIAIVITSASALVITGCADGPASTPVAPAAPTPVPVDDGLGRLVQLAEQRLATADTVAASKWGTQAPITDPAREKAVLDAAAAGATQRGLVPDEAVAIFQDQIAASKVVQFGLFSDWNADPTHAPGSAPDLGGIRGTLDQVTVELLDQLAATRTARTGPACGAAVRQAVAGVEGSEHLDPLHGRGLERAVRSLCSAG